MSGAMCGAMCGEGGDASPYQVSDLALSPPLDAIYAICAHMYTLFGLSGDPKLRVQSPMRC
jgi:hypothetical protein